jgi:hypothetical protein
MPPVSLRAKVSMILEGTALDAVNRMEHSWAFSFGSAGLTTGFPWRVVSGGRLTLASGDDGHPFGLPQPVDAEAEAARALVGRRVVSVAVDPETADLRITFGGGARLELLSGSTGYEAWQLNTADACIVAAAQGRLSEAHYVKPNVMVSGPWE